MGVSCVFWLILFDIGLTNCVVIVAYSLKKIVGIRSGLTLFIRVWCRP